MMNLENLTILALAFGGAFLVALWVSLMLWTYRDARNRLRDPLMHWLAVLLPAVLNLPGVLIYLILRPGRTLEEEYQQLLEEEALLTAIEEQPVCPGCERQAHHDWQYCPYCHTRLKKICQTCGQKMELSWNLCPYCGEPVPGARSAEADELPPEDDLPLQA